MSLWNRRRRRTGPTVYVVSSRGEFTKWVESQPDNSRYENIHNEACARGLVHLYPPSKFVVLPSADFHVLLDLHTRGFAVDNPTPQETEREKQIRHWKRKLARFGDPASASQHARAELQPNQDRTDAAAPPEPPRTPANQYNPVEPAAAQKRSVLLGMLRVIAIVAAGIILVLATNGGILLALAFLLVGGFIAVFVIGVGAEIAEGVIGPGHAGKWKSVLLGIVILFLGLVLVFRGCDLGGGGDDVGGDIRPSQRR